MARTAPAPNIPPIPGMCPSIALLAGGGDGGGSSGESAGKGEGDDHAAAGKGGENATGDSRGAPDYEKYPECGYASHPVDVVTGRAFTHPIDDLELPGPLPLLFSRMYSSKMADRDVGLGFGWGHTFGWEIEVGRRSVTVWNEQGAGVDFPMINVGDQIVGPWGWVLRRESWGFAVDADDGVWRLFSAVEDGGRRVRLTAIEDRNRNRISLTYDDGKLVEVVDSAGRVIRVVPTREGRIGSIRVQNAISQGQWVAFATYTYDERGNLAAATDADGHIARYEYDDDHRLTADTDRAGLCFHFVYDAEGRCVESWGDYPGTRDPSLAEGLPRYLYDDKTRVKGIHHCKFEWGQNGYSEVVDTTQVRRFFGNKHGLLDKSVTGGAVTTAKYNDQGRLLSRTDPLGATTSFQLDARGRVMSREEPLSRVTHLQRDALGLVVEITEPSGDVATITRDRFGNVVTITDASGATMSYRHDTRGLITEERFPNGGRVQRVYDAHGNLVELTYPNGGTQRYVYDALGRMISETDAEGSETRYTYSSRGDLTAIYDALGGVTRLSYDGEERLTEIVSPEGRVTRLVWGGYEKLCAIHEADDTWTRFLHDYEGQLLQVYNERGELHRYEYDPSGGVVAERTFDGRSRRFRYDLVGRVIRVEDDLRQPVEFAYNLAGDVIERRLPDGQQDTFEYNANGEIIAAIGTAGEIRFERDAIGRVVREIQTVGGDTQEVEITYDLMSDRVSRRTSLGHTMEIERDVSGAPVRRLLDGGHEITRQVDVFGRERERRLPRGGVIESSFDPLGRLERRRVKRPGADVQLRPGQPDWIGGREQGITAERVYSFDRDDWLIRTWDRQRGSTQHEYDVMNRLLAFVPDRARPERFRYDPTGDVHEVGAGAPGRAYGPGGRLEQRGHTDYRWDGAGRLVEKRELSPDGGDLLTKYAWDGAGRLASVEAPDGARVDFTYDSLSRRLQKRVSRPRTPGARPAPVSLTRFVWDGDTLVHEVERRLTDDVAATRTYVFEDDEISPEAHREAAGEWVEYVTDLVGTPERLVDAAGDVVCELERTAWGRLRPIDGATADTPLRLAGQYEDVETGLSYNRFRYYDPDLGMFLSPDPLSLGGGLQAYAYAPNALTWLDPLGLVKLTPAAKARLAKLPKGPGIYHIESKGRIYTGSAKNVKARLCGSGKHDTAEPMLNDPNAKITVSEVDTGKAKTDREKGRAIKVVEQKVMNQKGNVPKKGKSNNKIPALRPEKLKKYDADYQPKKKRARTF